MPAAPLARRCLLLLMLLATEVGAAAATELALFEGAAPIDAPRTATVRRLPHAEIWVFDTATARDAALARAGTGRALHVEGRAVLEREGPGTEHSIPEGAEVLWTSGDFRLLSLPEAGPMLNGCLEDLAPVAQAGPPLATTLTPGSSISDETALVGAVDEARYAQILAALCGENTFELDGSTRRIATRWAPDPTHPDGINLARDYLVDRFAAAGYDVSQQDFPFSYAAQSYTATNLIAVHPGTTLADEILVVGAHYDATTRSEEIGLPALGAEDNASGVAAVLHLAELLAGYETDRTIHFVAFGAEETGLDGSTYYVEQAVNDGLNIVGALTMDMISAWVDDFGIWIEGELPWQELMFALRDNVVQWTTLPYQLHYISFGSDHVPFQKAGIPALLAIDIDWDAYADYHRSTDTWDKVDTALGTQITRALAGTIADIATVRRKVAISDPPPGADAPRSLLALLPNRPNPFNPRTTLRFTLPEAGPVLLDIVDLRGRRIRALVDDRLEAGLHERLWDGTDDSGAAVASGLYFSRLSHAEGVRTRGLTLVR